MHGPGLRDNVPIVLTTQAAQKWLEDGRHLVWGGHRIFVREGGDLYAPPLLLIHGFPTSSFDWLPLWEDLAAHYRLLAFDCLGFGFSDKPRPYAYSLVQQADLARDLVSRLFGEDFHILAHDYGVSVAQELLARHGESPGPRPLSCMFLNGGLIPGEHRPRPIQKLLAGPLGGLLVRFVNRNSFGRSFSEVFGPTTKPGEAELDAFWSIITHDKGHLIQHKLLAYMAERRLHAARWGAVLDRPPCPIALINGTLDPVSGGHLVEAVQRRNPAIPAWRLDTVGHYPQTEMPAEVLRAYSAFRAGIA